MQKKIFSDQSLSELKNTEKKNRSKAIIHSLLFIISIVVAGYYFIEESFSLLTLLPVLFLPFLVFSFINLKKVKDEIKVREKHILLQKKNG